MQEQGTFSAVESRCNANDEDLQARWHRVVGRRSFLKGIGVAGVAAVPGSALLATEAVARSSRLSAGDVAILRFLAAAEIIESDLWQQYNELGGANGGNKAYVAALSNLDGDMSQYISDNTTTSSAMPRSSMPTCAPRARRRSISTSFAGCRAAGRPAPGRRAG